METQLLVCLLAQITPHIYANNYSSTLFTKPSFVVCLVQLPLRLYIHGRETKIKHEGEKMLYTDMYSGISLVLDG